MWYVYILKSELNGSYYKGSTNDLERRLEEHNSGKENYTSKYRPWKLVWSTAKESRASALVLERKLKNITSVVRLESFIRRYSVGGPDAPVGGLDPAPQHGSPGRKPGFFVCMWYVYILKSELDGSYYKGSTNDLERRLEEHNSGKEDYTSKYRPWKLVWSTAKESRASVLALERKLKNITSVVRLELFIRRYSVGGPDAPVGGLDPAPQHGSPGRKPGFFVCMWYVYILKSELTGSYYKGSTNDLERRLEEHNSGKEDYTSKYRPWMLVWWTA